MERFRRIAVALSPLAVALLVTGASADKVKLKDGTVIEGTVVQRPNGYWVKQADGTARVIPADQVASVEKPGAPAAGASSPGPAAPAAGANAATSYQQAFALLPSSTDPDAKALQDANDDAPDAAAVALVHKYDRSAQLLRQGATAARCDWGLDRTQGPELQLPFLAQARTMSLLIHLRVAVEIQEGHEAEAFNDAAASMAMGRHLGGEPYLVCRLIGWGVEMSAINAAAKGLPRAPPNALADFDKKLGSLPKALTGLEALRGDVASTVNWLHGLEKDAPQALFAPGGKLATLVGNSAPNAQMLQSLQSRWADPATRRADVAAMQTLADSAAPVFSVPSTEVEKAAAEWRQKWKEAALLAQLVVPRSPERIRQTSDVADVKLAMLHTAILIRQRGPDAAKTSRDPVAGGPFEYRQTPNGFELKSTVQSKGEPVTLTIGPGEPEKK